MMPLIGKTRKQPRKIGSTKTPTIGRIIVSITPPIGIATGSRFQTQGDFVLTVKNNSGSQLHISLNKALRIMYEGLRAIDLIYP